jgi:holin-like protein
MLRVLTLLLICQLAGEIAARAAGLPLPGPVLGMVLMFGWLAFKGGVDADTAKVTGGLLEHLSLLFVPAGVGVVLHLDVIAAEWPAILAALFVSTFAAILAAAATMRWLAPTDGPDRGDSSK